MNLIQYHYSHLQTFCDPDHVNPMAQFCCKKFSCMILTKIGKLKAEAGDEMKSGQVAFEFTWTDAWVLTALYCSHKNGAELDWPALLRMGEDLNFNTFKYPALMESLAKLSSNGIIQIKEKHIYYTQLGKQLIVKARFRPGGWFSRVDITLKVLNTAETGTADAHSDPRQSILSPSQFEAAYASYMGQPDQPIEFTPLVIPDQGWPDKPDDQ
jgi:hypothetical protein